MLDGLMDRLGERYEEWRYTADFDFGATTDDLADHYEIGDERMQKNAALYSLQLGFDAAAAGEIAEEKYEEILASAQDHVNAYYFDEDVETELILPETDRRTTEFRYHGCEEAFVERYRDLDHDPDRVVAIASSGIEPGMVAAEYMDAELDIVRYSHRRLDDDTVIDFNHGYEGEEIVLVDDEAYTGQTMTEVAQHLRVMGADRVIEEPHRDTRGGGLRGIISGLLDRDGDGE
ncbi:MAG: phosphoribosyltransferase [Candidatus Nanohaloarchaea archaeon]|nr:phosphoribosyltransferase [Candidatus Nanohaloarchaea archaeon]